MNRIFVFRFFAFLLTLMVLPAFASPPDGLWKAAYAKSYSTGDTLMDYTKMLLHIEGGQFWLINYDSYLVEKSYFQNEGSFRAPDSSLVFDQDSSKQKIYKLEILDDKRLTIVTMENPRTEIVFSKLTRYDLGGKKGDLKSYMLENSFEFDFSFFEGPFEIEFDKSGDFMVTNSVTSYFPNFSKWEVVSYDNELFIYFSGFAPFLHVVSMDANGVKCEDEFNTIFSGYFKKMELQQKFDQGQLLGIWQQKTANDDYLKSVPETIWDKELYHKQVWEIKEGSATLYSLFHSLDSPYKISKNGEMMRFMMFSEINNNKLKIISLEKKNLVVQRLDIFGELQLDTLVRQKKIPAPMKLNDYFDK